LGVFQKNDTVPKTGICKKINPQSVAYFSSSENRLLKHHVHHASHHKLTTKAPRFDTRFCQNPQQKRETTTAKKISQ
jgi:hypothetical protein